MNTQGIGAAGSIFYTLEFTNLSGHACTLRGYPGVSAVSLGGRRLGSPAAWGPPSAHVVRLANGATAYAILQYSDVVTSNSGSQPCDAVTAAGLRVYPKPDRVQDRAFPADGLHAQRAGLHERAAGAGRTTARSRALTAPLGARRAGIPGTGEDIRPHPCCHPRRSTAPHRNDKEGSLR
jgi:hypothetical protein